MKHRTEAAGHAKKWAGALPGFFAGILNGLLGAGGGTVIVPMLEHAGLPPRKAHATSIAVIVPLCVLSAALYMRNGSLSLPTALPFIPAGLAGAFVASRLLPHIPENALRRIFGLFMLYAAGRLLVR